MSDSSSPHKKLFLNASWLFGGKTVSGIAGALQVIVLARVLGVADYGLLVLVISYIDILNQFFDLRVWETATKYIGTYWENSELDKTRSMIKLSYLLDISTGVLAFIIAIVTAKLISVYILKSPEAYVYIWIYSLSLFISTANSTSNAILRVFDKFKTIAFITSIQNLIKLILVAAVLFSGYGIKAVLIVFVAVSFIGFFIRIWAVLKVLNEKGLTGFWNSRIGLIRDQWKGIAWFLGNTSFMATIRIGNDRLIGTMVLGYFAGKEAVGLYDVAGSVAKFIKRIVDPLNEAIYPELVKISSNKGVSEIRSIVTYSTRNLMKIIVPVSIIAIIFADLIIGLLFGEQYLPASNALRIIAAAAVLARVTFWINSVLLALGRPGLRTVLGLATTFVYLALLFILVPAYSYIGAAIALLGFSIFKSLMSYYLYQDSLRKVEQHDA
jgi:O-antigen/teichoic acid export membrane protein